MSPPIPSTTTELNQAISSKQQFSSDSLFKAFLDSPPRSVQQRQFEKILACQDDLKPELLKSELENYILRNGGSKYLEFITSLTPYKNKFFMKEILPKYLEHEEILKILNEKLQVAIDDLEDSDIATMTSLAYNLVKMYPNIFMSVPSFPLHEKLVVQIIGNEDLPSNTRVTACMIILLSMTGPKNTYSRDYFAEKLSPSLYLVFLASVISSGLDFSQSELAWFKEQAVSQARLNSNSASVFCRALGEYLQLTLCNSKFLDEELLSILSDFCEHPVENVRYHCQVIFEKTVQITKLRNTPTADIFRFLDQLPQDKRFRYKCLQVLIRNDMLKELDFTNVLKYLNHNRGLASASTGAIYEYLVKFPERFKGKCPRLICEYLNSTVRSDYFSRQMILEVLLPKLFKHDDHGSDIANLMIKNSPPRLTFALCHVALTTNAIKKSVFANGLWNGLIPVSSFTDALESSNEERKLHAFRILVDLKRPTKVITEEEAELFERNLKWQMNGQSPDFRTVVVQLITGFVDRSMHKNNKHMSERITSVVVKILDEILLEAPLLSYTRYSTLINLWRANEKMMLEHPGIGFQKRIQNLKSVIWSSYDDISSKAFEILQNILSKNNQKFELSYEQAITALASNTKPHDVAALTLISKLCVEQKESIVFTQFNNCFAKFEENFVNASISFPLYGVLDLIKSMKITSGNYDEIKTIAVRAKNLFMPVVGSAAPEGCLPFKKDDPEWKTLPESLIDLLRNFSINTQNSQLRHSSQLVLICSWRSMREVAKIFENLAAFHLENNRIEKVEEYFEIMKDILLEIRHKGAMEMTYESLLDLCTKINKSKDKNMQNLVEKWLKSILVAFTSDSSWVNKLCSTRRSAGLPFLINALLQSTVRSYFLSGSKNGGRQTNLLNFGIQELLKCSRLHNDVLKMHSLNILRWLFKDSKLGESTNPWAGHGFIASLEATKSNNWSVRTAGVLLFAALSNR